MLGIMGRTHVRIIAQNLNLIWKLTQPSRQNFIALFGTLYLYSTFANGLITLAISNWVTSNMV